MRRAPYRPTHEMDASIRLVSCYDAATDSIETRFDVLLGDIKGTDQFSFGISSGEPKNSPLYLETGKGIIDGFDVKVSSEDLINTFRAFANALETHKAEAELAKLTACEITEPEWKAVVKTESETERMWHAVRLVARGS